MSRVEFTVTTGFGVGLLAESHYSQAVRVGDRIETSGHGGWNDGWQFPHEISEEIAQTFDNLGRTLKEAGASWADVIHVNSYHVGVEADGFEEALSLMSGEFARRMGDRAPIWTAVGVTALGNPSMRVEVRVTAVVAS